MKKKPLKIWNKEFAQIISQSALPYRRNVPNWLKLTSQWKSQQTDLQTDKEK